MSFRSVLAASFYRWPSSAGRVKRVALLVALALAASDPGGGVSGVELTSADDPYRLLAGTAGEQTRSLRAAITNEVPDGRPILLPGGILGPKVLLINELAGSGGDYFPSVFRQQQAGPLIGTRTWGGLVKSSTHYALVDGGSLTAPDNAVFDPANNRWIAENEGVAPDIEVLLDARSAADGRDPQLERAVEEALRLLDDSDDAGITPPPFPTPSRRGSGQR